MKKILLALMLIVLGIGTAIGQTEIFVSAYTGNDADDGNSWKTAYRTIDKALDRITGSSGTFDIYVAQGYYLLEDNQDSGGNDSNVYVFSNDATINIYGGYASPPVDGSEPAYDPIEYVAAFNTQGTSTDSAFELDQADVNILFKDITILDAEQGDELNGAFMNVTDADGSSITFSNVKVYEWAGAPTVTERGFIYIREGSKSINVIVENSLFERNDNNDGAGQFIMVGNGSADIDMVVNNSIFRNIRGTGLNSALFYFNLVCNTDKGQSSILIENSQFYNIKRGSLSGQAPAVLEAIQVPSVTLRNNVFQGNRGGDGGVIELNNSGKLESYNNLYQDNYTGSAGGAVNVHGAYPNCNSLSVSDSITFNKDKFIANRAGLTTADGRGGAIMVAGDNVGGVVTDKIVTITDSYFSENYTNGASGGAVFINTNQNLTTTNTSYCNNIAHNSQQNQTIGRGGAIFAAGSGDLIVDNSTFVENAAALGGGAIHTRKDDLIISNCSYFQDNRSYTSDGGAIDGFETDYTIEDAYFIGNIADNGGGAIFITAIGTNTGTIDGANFTDNVAGRSGGAINTNSETTISNANFERNIANNEILLTGGGAIFTGDYIKLTNVNFEDNYAAEDGGALHQRASNLPSVMTSSDFDNVNFENNKADNDGGAVVFYWSLAPFNMNNSFFIGNEAVNGNGGAMHVYNQDLNFDNNIFELNKATSGRGGAIWLENGIYADVAITNNKFKSNSANEFGGALLIDTFPRTPSNDERVVVNYNDFLANSANEKGGAIAILDQGATYEVDELNYNRFYGNLLNGSDANIDIDERSDIYLRNAAGLYTGNVRTFDYNQLQFEPTPGNYPNGTIGTGYLLGGNNTGPADSFEITYTPFSFPNLLPVCEPIGCIVKDPTPVSPLVKSANGINTDTVTDYTSYTDVTVDASCAVSPTEVAFTARSNEAPDINNNIITSPVPELLITYDIIVTNNLTGEVEKVIGQVIDGRDTTTYDRVEDPSNEIPEADPDGPRDIYKTYFITVTDFLASGYTYSYTITDVTVLEATPLEFSFPQGLYSTTIVAEFCDSDQDGIYNHLETTSNIDPLGDDDGDGTPNYQDPDIEGYIDANGDGINDNFDSDGDGQPNFLDIDADNDGILDTEESGIDPNDPAGDDVPIDTDGDGVPDFLDLDSDNDSINDVDEGNPDAQDLDGDGMVDGPYGDNGLADSLENGDDTFDATVTDPTDSNNDGTPDYQSTDSDGDGTPDITDSDPYGTGEVPRSQDPDADANNNGIIDAIEDTDGDGIIDAYDVDVTNGNDTNNNGIDDAAEAELNPSEPDMDGDGIIDSYDPDQDGDGIMDVVDSNPSVFGEAKDSDGDGMPNYAESPNGVDPLEEDADNDGIPDYEDPDTPGFVDENGDGIDDRYDTDGDGRPDFLDLDSDNDGIPDSVEAGDDPANPVDTDNDGVPDYQDLDSDNDSINDIDEAGGTDTDGDGLVDNFTDVDQDGLHDPIDNQDLAVPNGETPINNGTPLPVPDTDGDGLADYRDLDSDDDGTFDISDTTPYGPGSTAPGSQDPSADQNNDGIVDDETDTDGDGIADIVDGKPNEFGDKPTICEIAGNTGTAGRTTHVGISTLDRNANDWLPEDNNIGAYIVLESRDKGFVVPRMSTDDITNNIGTGNGVEEGMVVWDTTDGCLKMFFDHDDDDTTDMVWQCISLNSCRNLNP